MIPRIALFFILSTVACLASPEAFSSAAKEYSRQLVTVSKEAPDTQSATYVLRAGEILKREVALIDALVNAQRKLAQSSRKNEAWVPEHQTKIKADVLKQLKETRATTQGVRSSLPAAHQAEGSQLRMAEAKFISETDTFIRELEEGQPLHLPARH